MEENLEVVDLSGVINATEELDDIKIKFETLQQVCDLISDLINNFSWSVLEKNQLVYIWTQVIKVYWSMCEKIGINPLSKV